MALIVSLADSLLSDFDYIFSMVLTMDRSALWMAAAPLFEDPPEQPLLQPPQDGVGAGAGAGGAAYADGMMIGVATAEADPPWLPYEEEQEPADSPDPAIALKTDLSLSSSWTCCWSLMALAVFRPSFKSRAIAKDE